MQFYDLLMLAVMGGAILFGFWKGLAWQVASLSAIFVSYFVARNFNQPVANLIGGDPAWNRFLAMFILFVGTSLLIWTAFAVVKSSIEKMRLSGFDRQIGAVVGAAQGLIVCTLITLFSVSLLGEETCRQICTSRSGNAIAHVLGHTGGIVPHEIGQYINPYIETFENQMQQHQNELPPSSEPDSSQPPFGPLQQNRWGQSTMYESEGPRERVGQLQPAGGNPSHQPSYSGQWQPPQSPPAPTQPQTGHGGAPYPWYNWRDAAKHAADELLNRTFDPNNQR